MPTQLATKANTTDVTVALATKANTVDVTTALATKANRLDMPIALTGNKHKVGPTAPLMWSLSPATESVDVMEDACRQEEVDNAINSKQYALTSASPTDGFPLVANGSIKGLVANSTSPLTFDAENLTLNLRITLSLGNLFKKVSD